MIIKTETLEIDIEPNAINEEEHLYVTITSDNGSVYNGRLYLVEEDDNPDSPEGIRSEL